MTNHTGTVDFVFWEAKTGKAYELNSSGTLVSGMAPFRPLPPNLGVLIPALPPCACIPGFMPGLKAIHERFGTKPWARLVEPAIRWAEEGHPVSSFEFGVLTEELRGNVYFPAGRELFTPGGFLPQVGDRFKKPELAKTLRRLSREGPDDFLTGEWARQFVAEANRLGWPIELEHLTEVPPRWGEPLRHTHRGHEILQLAPPSGRVSSARSSSASCATSTCLRSATTPSPPRASTTSPTRCAGPSSNAATSGTRRCSRCRRTSGSRTSTTATWPSS